MRKSIFARLAANTTLGGMTRLERAAGRFLRDPEGHPDPAPADPAPADPAPADPTPPASLMDEPPAADPAPADPAPEGDKPAEEQKPEGEAPKEGEEDEKPEGAPEEYAEFELPDGVALDTAQLDEFKADAKELNLTQEGAQRMVNRALALQQSWTSQAIEAFNTRAGEWREQTINDPEFGGTKLTDTLTGAKRVRDQFGDDDLKQVLDEFRLGDHPAVVRFFARVAQATSEDSFVKPGNAGGDVPLAKAIYTHPTSQK